MLICGKMFRKNMGGDKRCGRLPLDLIRGFKASLNCGRMWCHILMRNKVSTMHSPATMWFFNVFISLSVFLDL